jgi:hypothetical protein
MGYTESMAICKLGFIAGEFGLKSQLPTNLRESVQ